jgi:hypothetical protein
MADVTLAPNMGAMGQPITTHSAGQATFKSVIPGLYYVMVTADRYKDARDQVEVGSTSGDAEVWIRLERAPAADPSQKTSSTLR